MDEDYICSSCVEDVVIKAWIAEGTESPCSFCGKQSATRTIRELAGRVDDVIRQHYSYSDDAPGPSESPAAVVGILLGSSPETSQRIASELEKLDTPTEEVELDEEGFPPPPEMRYGNHVTLYPQMRSGSWAGFVKRVTHEARFFDSRTQSLLDDVFGFDVLANKAAVSTILPGVQSARIYRARQAEDKHVAEAFVRSAEQELSPPPSHKASAGRMNATGIRAFYGAFSEAVCVAEMRPHKGGLIVVGAFEVVRPMKLLDLPNIAGRYWPGSLFGNDKEWVRERAGFLEKFGMLASRPVQPHESILRYLPTQAVAEYIRNVLKLDGMVYRSAVYSRHSQQAGYPKAGPRDACNVVLFDCEKESIRLSPDSVRCLKVTDVSVNYRKYTGFGGGFFIEWDEQ
jgi:hypothetical protein